MISIPISFSYLALDAALCAVWICIYAISIKNRVRQLRNSLLAVFLVPLNILYTLDYWHPVTVFSVHILKSYISLEDLLFALFFGGIATALYPFLARNEQTTDETSYSEKLIAACIVASCSIVLWIVGMNSIFATSIGALLASILLALNHERLQQALTAGAYMTIVMFAIYVTGFAIAVNTEYVLRHIWLLYGTPLGLRFFGVPLTELVFAFCFGALFSIL